MEILNIEVTDVVKITLDNAESVSKVYVDTLDNVKNRYSDKEEEHTYSVSVSPADNIITINIEEELKGLDKSAFTVLINNVLGFYYDDKELYYKQVELLTNPCSTCLSKHNKERIMLFLLKKELFDYALEHNMDERIFYYIDIARMLDIDFKYSSKFTDNSVLINNKCKCCENCCSLC